MKNEITNTQFDANEVIDSLMQNYNPRKGMIATIETREFNKLSRWINTTFDECDEVFTQYSDMAEDMGGYHKWAEVLVSSEDGRHIAIYLDKEEEMLTAYVMRNPILEMSEVGLWTVSERYI